MKQLILPFLLFVAVLASAQSNEIIESQNARFAAQITKDSAALANFLGEELIYVHSNGYTEDKTSFLKSVLSNEIVYKNIVPEKKHTLRRYGKTGIVNGKMNVDGQFKGEPFSITLLYTAVYRNRRGTWQLVSWQSTKPQTERVNVN